jgi:fumarate reductase (CoM/CoB) subunit A
MEAMNHPYELVATDVLVLGGGGAAMRAAIEASRQGCQVLIVSKGPLARSGTTPAACPSYQAAVAAEDPRDSPEQAFEDTRKEGRYLGDENLIWALTAEATLRAEDMAQWRLKYEMNGDRWLQVQHPGHTFARNLVIRGCGYAMASVLRMEARRSPGVSVREDVMVTDLLHGSDGSVVGALGLDLAHNRFLVFHAPAVVLATGGYCQMWGFTDTGPDVTGDGVAAAYRAGADLVDMEMSLYYPACLRWPPELEGTLVQYEGLSHSEYGGAPMLNGLRQPIIDPGLPPVRDEMLHIMVTEILEGRGTPNGGIYIDTPNSPKGPEEFMRIVRRLDALPYNQLRDLGLDVTRDPIEVAPGVHFTLGGVRIDEWTRTSLPGLFAAGEASGNVHGANRTSGNALAETQVFGRRAGEAAARRAREVARPSGLDEGEIQAGIARSLALLDRPKAEVRAHFIKKRIKQVMDTHMGWRRDEQSMRAVLAEVRRLREDEYRRVKVADRDVMSYEWQQAIEVGLMLDLAEVIAESGLARQESRGHHWRTDFPESSDEWCRHTRARRGADGQVVIDTVPVVRIDRSVLATTAD